MDEPVRFGVIGAGWFASRRHLPDIERNARAALTSICRRDERALDRLAAHFQPEHTYTDWRHMLDAGGLDAVLIATPPSLHYEQAHEALERGLHVLVEKPLTVRSVDARQLCALAAERGLVVAVALNPPYWAHCHRIRGAVRAGRLGAIESVDVYWTGNAEYVFGEAPKPADLPGIVTPTMYRADPAQCGGGYLSDGGPHLVSEVLWVTERRAAAVTCQMDRLPSDRRAALTIALEGGALATVSCVGDSKLGARRVHNTFGGSVGTVTVEGSDFTTTIQTAGAEPETFTERDLPPVAGPIDNFVDAIRSGGPASSPGEHGLHVVQVVEAAYESARTGTTVAIASG